MSQIIALPKGDSIGSEIMEARLRGLTALDKHGQPMPEKTVRKHCIALKDSLTTSVGGGFTPLNVQLRREFNLYTNVSAVLSVPRTRSYYENIGLSMVHENIEGAY